MRNVLLIVVLVIAIAGCTTVNVEPVGSNFRPESICIVENPRVDVKGFLPVVQKRIEHHGYPTRVVRNANAIGCEYLLSYIAMKNWDFAWYLHYAVLILEKNNEPVARAEYKLKAKGGYSLAKWKSTGSKIEPVVDELLGKKKR